MGNWSFSFGVACCIAVIERQMQVRGGANSVGFIGRRCRGVIALRNAGPSPSKWLLAASDLPTANSILDRMFPSSRAMIC